MENKRISAGGLRGVVYIQLLRGKDLRAKNASYAVMQLGKFSLKTDDKKQNPPNANFNFFGALKVDESDVALQITVFDKGPMLSDFVGSVTVDLALLEHQEVFDDWVELHDPRTRAPTKRIRCGSLHIVARYISELAQRTIEISNFDQSVTEEHLYDIVAPCTKSKFRIERSYIYTNVSNRKYALVELDTKETAMSLWDRSLGSWPNAVIIRKPFCDITEIEKRIEKEKEMRYSFLENPIQHPLIKTIPTTTEQPNAGYRTMTQT